ncbi:MAG: RNA-binding protein, partial [Pseudomonadota bacterium]
QDQQTDAPLQLGATRKKAHRGSTSSSGAAAHARRSEDAERRCAVTGERRPKFELIRFVAGPEGIVPDLGARLPGRGVWISATRAAVAEALKRKAFARSLKTPVSVSVEMPDLVARLLTKRALDRLSLANKAGLAVAGFSKVDSTLRDGTIAALLHAADAAEDGCRKLDSLARVATELFDIAPLISSRFTSDEMSLAFGRGNVVHAALKQGGASASFLNELMRLEKYTAGASDVDASSGRAAHCDSGNTDRV